MKSVDFCCVLFIRRDSLLLASPYDRVSSQRHWKKTSPGLHKESGRGPILEKRRNAGMYFIQVFSRKIYMKFSKHFDQRSHFPKSAKFVDAQDFFASVIVHCFFFISLRDFVIAVSGSTSTISGEVLLEPSVKM